uniref:Ig-like domain-containing protein n=1 Tax=Haplochromis burtoni TaxID=8153 RepID=A0A3Q3CQL0_HAPBU
MKLRVGGLLSNLTCSQFQFLTSICSVLFPLSDQKNITAESGQDFTLTCRAPNNKTISVVKWSRADLRDEYVLLYKDNKKDPENQHPSFKNRVDLQDKQMKDGDVSLILNNVTINDTGTYECVVIPRGGGSSKPIIELSVCVIRGEAASWLLIPPVLYCSGELVFHSEKAYREHSRAFELTACPSRATVLTELADEYSLADYFVGHLRQMTLKTHIDVI